MVAPHVRAVLAFLRERIRLGLDDLTSARAFAKGMDGLDPTGRLFLEAALSSDERLDEFHRRFVLCLSEVRIVRMEHRSGGGSRMAQPRLWLELASVTFPSISLVLMADTLTVDSKTGAQRGSATRLARSALPTGKYGASLAGRTSGLNHCSIITSNHIKPEHSSLELSGLSRLTGSRPTDLSSTPQNRIYFGRMGL